ncbi:hypothetical protein RF11_06684 [Thelohanellus kitauei]|uniref:Uncharacterized protein n=1 Tax=Thelohanellus kitauei TaxID=669202 RepID=A0A0C2N9C0_THEKT|nr:hypothetical protein RF11_06684 [Thelohanellus kitauei]
MSEMFRSKQLYGELHDKLYAEIFEEAIETNTCSHKPHFNLHTSFTAHGMIDKLFTQGDRYHKYYLPTICLMKVILLKYDEFVQIISDKNEVQYIKTIIKNIIENRKDVRKLMTVVFSRQLLDDPAWISWSRNPFLMHKIQCLAHQFKEKIDQNKINTSRVVTIVK